MRKTEAIEGVGIFLETLFPAGNKLMKPDIQIFGRLEGVFVSKCSSNSFATCRPIGTMIPIHNKLLSVVSKMSRFYFQDVYNALQH